MRRARGIPVEHHPMPLYRSANPLRRLIAAVASGGIAVLMGVLTAIVLAFGTALAVTWMTDLLRK